jgi:tRNA(Arg) A34 adenosine deaminase TadA/catechol 2,3-dioxygenase-like lactoylglutathione lyase family enzyme
VGRAPLRAAWTDTALAGLLERAVRLAVGNAEAGGHPFGALVERDGEVLGSGVNAALRDRDPVAHAETVALRDACGRLGTLDLSGATLVSSAEPCPMCLSAALLAGVSRIVYAAPQEAAAAAGFVLPPALAELDAAWRGLAPGLAEHVPTPGAEEPFARFSRAAEGWSRAPLESPVRELRLAVTVPEYERTLAFYRDGLGLPVVEAWDAPEGNGAVLDAGRATLELLSTGQAELVDRVEVGERVAGPIRVALEVEDSARAAEELVAAGAQLVGGPVVTPWRHRNVRLDAPGGLQLTLYSVLDETP